MTVTYTADVTTLKHFGIFWKLLFRWKGSIYKLVWPDLTAYTALYFIFNLSYRFAMNEQHKRMFEAVARYCADFSTFIPMSFVLGFYVSIVVQRWWDQWMVVPWPDTLAVFVSTNIHGNDERGRVIRRTIMRYANLSFVYTMSRVCTRVKKRFPTLDHLVDAGVMTSNEKEIFEMMEKKTPHMLHWMPLVWAGSIVTRARKEGRIRDDFAVKTIVDTISSFRAGLGGVLNYDWISIPLVYTQTVTLAVYTFFAAELMGRQFVKKDGETSADIYFPIFTFLQFFFYMGWLRVAETLVNPFGEDDDDFEINWIIDRNLQVSYLIVDEMHEDHPELVRDQYWGEVAPAELPYTAETEQYRRDPPQGSTANVEVKDAQFVGSMVEPVREVDEKLLSGVTSAKDVESAADDLVQLKDLPSTTPAVDIPAGAVLAGGDGRLDSSSVRTRRTTGASDSGTEPPSVLVAPSPSAKKTILDVLKRWNSRKEDQYARLSRGPSQMSSGSRRSRPLLQRGSSDATRRTSTDEPAPDTIFMMSDLDIPGSGSQRSLKPLAADSRASSASGPVAGTGSDLLVFQPAQDEPGPGSTAERASGAGEALSAPEGARIAAVNRQRSSGGSEKGSQKQLAKSASAERMSIATSGSEERRPKFLPGEYNFMIEPVVEDDENVPETPPGGMTSPVPSTVAPRETTDSAAQTTVLAQVLSSSLPPASASTVSLPETQTTEVAAGADKHLLTQLLTTIIEAAGVTVQPSSSGGHVLPPTKEEDEAETEAEEVEKTEAEETEEVSSVAGSGDEKQTAEPPPAEGDAGEEEEAETPVGEVPGSAEAGSGVFPSVSAPAVFEVGDEDTDTEPTDASSAPLLGHRTSPGPPPSPLATSAGHQEPPEPSDDEDQAEPSETEHLVSRTQR